MPFRYTTLCFDDPPREGRMLDLLLPAGPVRAPAVFMVHGGGWRAGRRDQYLRLMLALRERGHICGSTDYRLEGSRIGDQRADVAEGYRLFRAAVAEVAGPLPVVVYGGSAGGHLAGLLAFDGARDHGAGWVPPTGAVLASAPATFEPWDEIFPPIWRSMQDIIGVPWEREPAAYAAQSLLRLAGAQVPPLLLLDGANEHMFLRRHGEELVARLRACGVAAERHEFADAEHGFFYDVVRRPQREAFAVLSAFLDRIPKG